MSCQPQNRAELMPPDRCSTAAIGGLARVFPCQLPCPHPFSRWTEEMERQNDYPTTEESSAFVFHSSMKDRKEFHGREHRTSSEEH